jgi:hypothetical protein
MGRQAHLLNQQAPSPYVQRFPFLSHFYFILFYFVAETTPAFKI